MTKIIKPILFFFLLVFSLAFITGCGSNDNIKQSDTNVSSVKNNDNYTETNISSPYFLKGVYLNYSAEDENPVKNYFYVFYDEKSGHTDDGSVGIGLPFSCEQFDKTIRFSFGDSDPDDEDILTIESVNNGIINGYFKDGKKLVFELLTGVNPDSFDAETYIKNSQN